MQIGYYKKILSVYFALANYTEYSLYLQGLIIKLVLKLWTCKLLHNNCIR